MAAPGDVIREGFICPVCMATLDRQDGLLEHVRTQHPESGDEDVLGQVKGWIGRMGKKLKLKGEEMTASAFVSAEGVVSSRRGSLQVNFAFYEDPNHFQEPGKSVSHTEEFLRVRSQGVNRTQREQSRLLMRLEKLLQVVDNENQERSSGVKFPGGVGRFSIGGSAVKRKAKQKSLVPWAPDKDVPLCPICASEFNILTRRKHHCRLCGYIMCSACSNFLSESAARRFIKPVEETEGESVKEPTLGATFLSRSNSENSIASLPSQLNSYMPWSSNSVATTSGNSGEAGNAPRDRTLRVCNWCRQVLESVMRQREEQLATPMIVQLYDQLQSALQTVKDEIANYEVMLEAVRRGESQDALTSLTAARNRLLRLANFADDCSRQITTLPTPTDRAVAEAAEQGILLPKTGLAKVQANVRAMVAHTLTHSPALRLLRQPLPTSEEYERLVKEQRRAEQRQREEAAIRAAANGSALGWTPAPPGVAAPELHDDPLEQQIANIREYARLARDAGKYEELLILEDNLKMLEQERRAQGPRYE